MRKYNFARADAAFAQSAQRQFAELNKAMSALQDKMSGLNRALKVPVPKGGSRYTKTVRTNPSILDKLGEDSIGDFLSGSILAGVGLGSGGSFYPSSSQISSLTMQSMQKGQRIL